MAGGAVGGSATRGRFDYGPESQLISDLVTDGRMSYEDLAERAGTSRQTVWRRVRKMVGSVVWGFATVIDHQALGWRQYMLTIHCSPDAALIGRVEKAEALAASWGTVRPLHSMLVRGAKWRFVLHVAAKDSLVMEAYWRELRTQIPEATDWTLDDVEHVLRESGCPNPRSKGAA